MLKKIPILILISLPVFASSVSVSVIKPVEKAVNITIEANGVVESKNKILITAQTTGILHFSVTQNAYVHKNQIIATITNKVRDKNIGFLKNSLILQKNAIKTEQINFTTIKEKYKMGVGTKNSYLHEKIVLTQMKENYYDTNNKYQTLLLEQDNATVYAPTNGIITNLQANNSYIHYGAKIATLLGKNNLVKIFIDGLYAQQIKKGMLIKLSSSYKNCNAIVVNVVPKSTDNLIEVIAEPKKELPLNLRVDAHIILQKIKALLIPKEAIVLIDNHPAIYIVDNKSIAHLFFIKIQKDMITSAFIKATLPKDAKIVLKNAYMLHDNLAVSIE